MDKCSMHWQSFSSCIGHGHALVTSMAFDCTAPTSCTNWRQRGSGHCPLAVRRRSPLLEIDGRDSSPTHSRMCVVLPDCWTALGYSQGNSTRKRRLLSKDVSHTWWADACSRRCLTRKTAAHTSRLLLRAPRRANVGLPTPTATTAAPARSSARPRDPSKRVCQECVTVFTVYMTWLESTRKGSRK